MRESAQSKYIAQWLVLLPHSKKSLSLNSPSIWGFSMWSLHVVIVWFIFGYSGFLPQFKDMHLAVLG